MLLNNNKIIADPSGQMPHDYTLMELPRDFTELKIYPFPPEKKSKKNPCRLLHCCKLVILFIFKQMKITECIEVMVVVLVILVECQARSQERFTTGQCFIFCYKICLFLCIQLVFGHYRLQVQEGRVVGV